MKNISHLVDLNAGSGLGYVSPDDIYLLTVSSLQLAFFILILSLILYKVKMNLSKQLIIVHASFLLCFVARFILDLMKVTMSRDNKNAEYNNNKVVVAMKILNYLGGRLSKIAMIYFVF